MGEWTLFDHIHRLEWDEAWLAVNTAKSLLSACEDADFEIDLNVVNDLREVRDVCLDRIYHPVRV